MVVVIVVVAMVIVVVAMVVFVIKAVVVMVATVMAMMVYDIVVYLSATGMHNCRFVTPFVMMTIKFDIFSQKPFSDMMG